MNLKKLKFTNLYKNYQYDKNTSYKSLIVEIVSKDITEKFHMSYLLEHIMNWSYKRAFILVSCIFGKPKYQVNIKMQLCRFFNI